MPSAVSPTSARKSGTLAGPKPRSVAERRLVRHLALAAVDLHDAVAAQALPEVLVRAS